MTLKGSSGALYRLDAKPFSSGGEGAVYGLTDVADRVVKLYHPDRISQELEQKLQIMASRPPSSAILSQVAWPLDLVYDLGRNFRGFVMPRLQITDELGAIYSYPPKRNISYQAKLIIAQNICAVISEVHRAGFVFGDFNPKNIGIDLNTCRVAFLDTDSYHIVTGNYTYRCNVCLDGYVAPELIAKCAPYKVDAYANAPLPTFTPETDNFALAIHIFKLLMNGFTPFNGIRETESASTASPGVGNQAIKRDSYCFKPGNKPQSPAVPPLNVLPPEIADLFTRAFMYGRLDPKQRPSAVEWHKALRNYESSLVSCSKNSAHMYLRGLSACPWCEADDRFRRAMSPSPQLTQRTFSAQPVTPPPPPPSPVVRPPAPPPRPIVSPRDMVGIWTGNTPSYPSSMHIPYLYFSFSGPVYCIWSKIGKPPSYDFTAKFQIADNYSVSVDSAGQTVCAFGNCSAILSNKNTMVIAGEGLDGTYSNQAAPPPAAPPAPVLPVSSSVSSGGPSLTSSAPSGTASPRSSSLSSQTASPPVRPVKKRRMPAMLRWITRGFAVIGVFFVILLALYFVTAPPSSEEKYGLSKEEYIPLGEVNYSEEYCTNMEELKKPAAFFYRTYDSSSSIRAQDNFGTYYEDEIYSAAKDDPDQYNTAEAWREYQLDGSYGEIRGRVILPYGRRTDNSSESYLRILGDGVVVYCSEPVTAGCNVQDFTVDISGFSRLKVHIQGCEMLNLVDCGLYKDSSIPTVSTAEEPEVYSKPQAYLGEFRVFNVSKREDGGDDGHLSDRGETTDNWGTTYTNGCCLFTYHENNRTEEELWSDIWLGGRYQRIKGIVVLSGEYGGSIPKNVYFSVYGDGELLYQSAPLEEGCEPQGFDLDISGITTLRVASTDHTNDILRVVDCMLYKE